LIRSSTFASARKRRRQEQVIQICADARTGKVLWTDETRRGEAGAVLDAGPVLLALTGDSELVAFEPSAKGYRELAHYKVSATSGLPYPIVSGNRVFVKGRDTLTLWALD
jgi:hypothetical protein